MKRYGLYIAIASAAVLLLTTYATLHRVQAATLTVNSTTDTTDVSPGDGICADSLGNCTLRAAIQEANALAGLDTIVFNIGTGNPTITPLSALPTITSPVIINGNTGGATRVELNGSSAGASVPGLDITAGGSTVRNMVINRFSLHGIVLTTNGGNTIEGNYIGTNAAGTADLGNSVNGVFISSAPSNIVGGTAASARNVISGNTSAGVLISGTGATGNKVEGNYIGTDVTGTADLGNSIDGVLIVSAPNNTIGGTTSGARNVISGNTNYGVEIFGSGASGNRIEGNYIGTDAAGTADLGNSFDGVRINSAPNNTIGGTATGAANLIAFNDRIGVGVIDSTATGNVIRGNSIHSNTNIGIDLNINGVTPNDPLAPACPADTDTGPNNLQNFPVITLAGPTVQGTLNSTASTTFTLDFYSSPTPDSTGFGEGQTYRGSTTVTTDANCMASFDVTFMISVPAGQWITATATHPAGNTSEFSQSRQVLVPTAIELAAFAATSYDGGVLLEWKTGFEVDNLGFNLYREESGKRVLVNPQLVAGSALVAGSGVAISAGRTYAFWDSAASSKASAEYWLEEINLSGRSNWHGPYLSKFVGGATPARSDSSWLSRLGNAQSQPAMTRQVEQAASPRSMKPEQIKLQSGLAGQAAVKMWVKREGWYRVTASELTAAGLDPRANTALLQLYADGLQLPINVIANKNGSLSAVEFYARGLDTAFSDQRVYWLVSGTEAGLRMEQVKGSGYPRAAGSFLYTAERKDRTIYFSGLRNGERENFFGAVIGSSPLDQTLTIQQLDESTERAATLEVALQGVTTLPHRVWVYLNDRFAGESFFEGQANAVARFTVAQSQLREGDNHVRLVAQSGSGDISLVDYIRLSHWHRFVADDNALRFTATGGEEITISGFTSGAIRVLDVTDPNGAQELVAKVEQTKTGYEVTVASRDAGERRLLAIADEQAGKPAKIAENQPSSLRQPANGADLLIITQREFFAAIAPLTALRQSQGLSVGVVDIEDIYDEFSFGENTPQAVKDFAAYATNNWKKKPRYVLLAGDASYDPKNYLGLGGFDLVPTKLLDTVYMETASDDWFADFNNDGVPELAVGRLPFRNAAEAATMIAKIVGYEKGSPSEEVLLVADSNDGFDFEAASAQLVGTLPSSLKVNQINRRADTAIAKTRLMEAINRGQKLVNYTGHGSVNQWRGNLLVNEDALQMTNTGHLPVFVMMTCLNGYFDDPALDSLAESLLKAERGGAVAVWSSSGMTLPSDQARMNQEFYRSLFGGKGSPPLGDAIREAKTKTIDVDIRRTWVLLGDPTMRLR